MNKEFTVQITVTLNLLVSKADLELAILMFWHHKHRY